MKCLVKLGSVPLSSTVWVLWNEGCRKSWLLTLVSRSPFIWYIIIPFLNIFRQFVYCEVDQLCSGGRLTKISDALPLSLATRHNGFADLLLFRFGKADSWTLHKYHSQRPIYLKLLLVAVANGETHSRSYLRCKFHRRIVSEATQVIFLGEQPTLGLGYLRFLPYSSTSYMTVSRPRASKHSTMSLTCAGHHKFFGVRYHTVWCWWNILNIINSGGSCVAFITHWSSSANRAAHSQINKRATK